MAPRRPVKKRAKRRPLRKARPPVTKRPKKSAARSTKTTARGATSLRAKPSSTTGDTRRLVLLVEDDAAARSGYAEFLADSGFRVVAVGAASSAVEHAGNDVPDVVLTDIALPDLNGK
jgi:PleD family two-component response regulator